MKRSYYIVAGCCMAGLVTGYTVKRLSAGYASGQSGGVESGSEEAGRRTGAAGDSSPAAKGKKPALLLMGPHSTDTLESVLGLGFEKGDYARLAAWMLDASEQDIAAYWQNYRDKKGEDNDIYDLIFINWTRLNPQSAVAATKGTPNEKHAWWAWACHDPVTALATAKATSPDFVANVGWGIGEFHPDWLMKNFDQIPESARRFSVMGLCKWDDCQDPLKIMTFLKENNQEFMPGIFKSLIRKDPLAAMDWLRQNGNGGGSRYSYMGQSDPTSVFVSTLTEAHPDLLQQVADQLPSGALKWKMQEAQFDHLLKTDPEAAIELAKSTKAPNSAANRLASAGLTLVSSDPDQAFELAKKMLEVSPNVIAGYGSAVVFPNGGITYSGGSDESARKFTAALIAKDPEQLMALVMPTESSPNTSTFSNVAGQWAQKDIIAYSSWVNEQSDPVVRDPAAQIIASKLTNDGNYSAAIEWAMSESDKSRTNGLVNVIFNWRQNDPVAAKAWLKSANLSEQERQTLKLYLEP